MEYGQIFLNFVTWVGAVVIGTAIGVLLAILTMRWWDR